MLSNLPSKKSRKPRFKVSFRIIDLINLPQLSGSCYIKWMIKDSAAEPISKPLSSSSTKFSSNGFLPQTAVTSGGSKYSSLSSEFSLSNSSNGNYNSSVFGNTIKGVTSKKQIENHKVRFGVSQEVPDVKFEINKKINNKFLQLEDRFLILNIYSEAENDNSNPNSEISSIIGKGEEIIHSQDKKTYLGTIKINLVDYVFKNFDPKSVSFYSPKKNQKTHPNFSIDKYLLQESKINSILSIAINLELIRGDYHDIYNHNYIKNGVYDPPVPTNNATFELNKTKETLSSIESSPRRSFTSQRPLRKSLSRSSSMSSTKKTKPPRPHSKLINEQTNGFNSQVSRISSNNSVNTAPKHVDSSKGLENIMNISGASNINNVDLITKLYYQTFKVPWDERPNEFNPKECVEDIFQGGNGWKRTIDGANLIDLNYESMDSPTTMVNSQSVKHPSLPHYDATLSPTSLHNRNRNISLASIFHHNHDHNSHNNSLPRLNFIHHNTDHQKQATAKLAPPSAVPQIFLSTHDQNYHVVNGAVNSPDSGYIMPFDKLKPSISGNNALRR